MFTDKNLAIFKYAVLEKLAVNFEVGKKYCIA